MTHEVIERWIAAYEAAWRAPYDPTMSGLDGIAELWGAERSEGEQFEMSHEVVALEGDTAVVRVHVHALRGVALLPWRASGCVAALDGGASGA